MTKILWLSDEPGWAFDKTSRELSSQLDEYEHDFAYYKTENGRQIKAKADGADLLVCHHPAVILWLHRWMPEKPILLRVANRAKKELLYRVMWFCDRPGWAYENIDRTLASMLPAYCHEFAFKDNESIKQTGRKVARADVIVCNNAQVLNWFSAQVRSKSLLRFSTARLVPLADVIWFCDMRGWAYDQRAWALSQKLTNYSHHFVYYWDYANDEQRKAAVAGSKIVICMCAAYVSLLATRKKALACVGGSRLLGIDEHSVN